MINLLKNYRQPLGKKGHSYGQHSFVLSKLIPGATFKGQWLKDDVTVSVIAMDVEKNTLEVQLKRPTGQHNEEWNLEHTLWGFERGDYKFIEPLKTKKNVSLHDVLIELSTKI